MTPAGECLARQLAEAFAHPWSAVADAQRSDQVVTLSMLPSVAMRWFAPRLGDFMMANPDIDLRITASRHIVDFIVEGVDAAIRHSTAQPSNLEAVKLGTETVTPVCSANYAKDHALHVPADMHRATLLCGDIPEDWPAWFEAAGCQRPPPTGPHLGDDGAILQAAAEGQGVVLGRSLLVEDDVATGRLIAPFTVSLDASHAYWFVQPKGAAPTHGIDAVKTWLVGQFEE